MKDKLIRLKEVLSEMGSVLIAYSGGVDSTFLLKVSHDVLGDRVLAVTAISETYPEGEIQRAVRIATGLSIRHRIIETEELSNESFSSNPPERCYYCKGELFTRLIDIARQEGIAFVIDGSNHDDTGDFRPGMQAAKDLGIRSPLKEVGLTKEEIRVLSAEMGLETWDAPSSACLSSRFPYGMSITKEALKKVGAAESAMRRLGFIQFRVRHYGDIARIEVEKSEIPKFADEDLRKEVVSAIKSAGYTYICLDLEGYRTGSMNEVLKTKRVNY